MKMRKRIQWGAVALAVLAFSAVAQAQETYSISATVGQVTKVDRARDLSNRRGCVFVGLSTTCTQADVDAAVVSAGITKPTIYPDSIVGRADFLKSVLARDIKAMWDAVVAQEKTDYCDWFENAATTAQKNAVCSAAGLPDGCSTCRN